MLTRIRNFLSYSQSQVQPAGPLVTRKNEFFSKGEIKIDAYSTTVHTLAENIEFLVKY